MSLPDIAPKISLGLSQNRIDAYIVKQIHDITKKYDTLLESILDQGEHINSKPSDGITNSRTLCGYLDKLSKELLLDLWQGPARSDFVLKCIQIISYMQRHLEISNEKFDGYPWNAPRLFKILTQPFAHSRTLMGTEGSKLIMKLVDPNFDTKNYMLQVIRTNSDHEPIDGQKLLVKISSFGKDTPFGPADQYGFKYLLGGFEPYTITLLKKTGGAQFGGVFEVKLPSQGLKRYYCKAYYNYPVKGNFNSEKAFASSISFVCSSDIPYYIDPQVEKKYEPLDFKELFIYKVLEFLEIGPHVHFFKVPILKDGFFIMTEDLSTPEKQFIEIGKMNKDLETLINTQLLNVQYGEIEQETLQKFKALSGLLELDTINRIFKLHDSNDGNFGYLDTKASGSSSPPRITQAVAQRWLMEEHEFKIVDFIAPFDNKSEITPDDWYVVDDIFNTFLSGNTITKYVEGRLMDRAIRRHFDGGIEDEELKRKHKDEKIFFGQQVIQSLNQRFFKFGGLMRLLFLAKAYVEIFLRGEKCEEISDEYIEQGLADSDKYIKGIVRNYVVLKNAIEAPADL